MNILAADQFDAVSSVLFWLFALMVGGSALAVVISRNVVRMAVALLFTLAGVAGLYFLLNAEFLAAVQLVVYAGGTLILIVFGVMLTTKSPFSRFEPKLPEIVIATSLAVVLLTALVMAIPTGAVQQRLDASAAPAFLTDGSMPEPLKSNLMYDPAAGVLSMRTRLTDADRQELARRSGAEAKAGGADLSAFNDAVQKLSVQSSRLFAGDRLDTSAGYPMVTLGEKLLGAYLVPFELVSVLLLVVMIGAAYLAKGRRRPQDAGTRQAMEAELSREARQWT